jgi:hypothetical protein
MRTVRERLWAVRTLAEGSGCAKLPADRIKKWRVDGGYSLTTRH